MLTPTFDLEPFILVSYNDYFTINYNYSLAESR